MQSLDMFLSRLLPKVPGCPDPLAKQALVDAAIEFCEQTSIIKTTSEPQDVEANLGVYDLDLPNDTMASVTLKAWYNTTPLTPAPAEMVDSILAYVNQVGTETPETGVPRHFYEYAPGSIALYPVPREAAPLAFSALVATKPTRKAQSLDDVLYEDWVESVVAGAAGRLCAMQGQLFTNEITAARETAKFWADITSASNVSRRGRIRTSMTVRGRNFVCR